MQLQLSQGKVDITPDRDLVLAGFSERGGTASAVNDTLEINALALKDGSQLVLMYSIDTLFVPKEFESILLEKFGVRYGLSTKNLWLVATHTHFAPALDKTKPNLGEVDDKYYEFVIERLIKLTETLLSSTFESVAVQYCNGTSGLNVNRRKQLLRPSTKFGLFWKTLLYPNHNGEKDDNIHLVKFVDKNGMLKSCVWSYACHPVGYTEHKVSADFIGAVRDSIRRGSGNDSLSSLFFVGFAGDLKPDVTAVTKTKWLDQLGYFFQYKPKYVKFPSLQAYKKWVANLEFEVRSVFTDGGRTIDNTYIKLSTSTIGIDEIIGSDKSDEVMFKKCAIGNDLTFVGCTEEVLVGYKAILDCVFQKSKFLIGTGCLAGTKIYLPTDGNVREGGYEVETFKDKFSVDGTFKQNLCDKVTNTLRKL